MSKRSTCLEKFVIVCPKNIMVFSNATVGEIKGVTAVNASLSHLPVLLIKFSD